MRIGIDCRAYGSSHGYMGKYIESFVSHLEQNEDSNEFVLFFNEREFGEFTTKSPRLRAVKTSVKIGSIREQIFFPYELYREKLDIMLFSHPISPVLYRGKSVLILSDLAAHFYPDKHKKGSIARHWNNFLLQSSIRKAHAVIAFSETIKRDIIEIFDTHEDRIRVIPPVCLSISGAGPRGGSEIQQFLFQESIDEKYMLFVWDLKEYRNIPRLLEAYHLLLEEEKVQADLVLVGKEDPTYHKIRSTLIQLKLQNRVHIYNVLDEEKIELLYRNASLYILPSLYEGSEEALLAPLAYSLPIVSSSLPSITAVLSKDEAVFFRPMSVLEMKEALAKALSHPLQAQKKRDMSAYSVPAVSKNILAVLAPEKGDSDM